MKRTRPRRCQVGCQPHIGAHLAWLEKARGRSAGSPIALVRNLAHIIPMWPSRRSSVASRADLQLDVSKRVHQGLHGPGSEAFWQVGFSFWYETPLNYLFGRYPSFGLATVRRRRALVVAKYVVHQAARWRIWTEADQVRAKRQE